MRRGQILAGVLAPIVALTGIGVAILIHRSWWRLTGNAISDLGKVGLHHNWVLNVSLVVSAALAIYYATGLLKEATSTVQKAGIGIFILGLVFLALIGIFPEGTSPHYYVSWGFFIFASLGFLVAGIGLGLAGEKDLGLFSVVLFAVGWALALWAKNRYPGVAPAEFIGAFGVIIWHYVVMWKKFRGAPRPRG